MEGGELIGSLVIASDGYGVYLGCFLGSFLSLLHHHLHSSCTRCYEGPLLLDFGFCVILSVCVCVCVPLLFWVYFVLSRLCDIHFLYIGALFYSLYLFSFFISPFSYYLSILYFYLHLGESKSNSKSNSKSSLPTTYYLYERCLCLFLYTRPHLGKVYSPFESLFVVERGEIRVSLCLGGDQDRVASRIQTCPNPRSRMGDGWWALKCLANISSLHT